MAMGKQIIYSDSVSHFFTELFVILYEKGYFSFIDTAKSYADKLIDYGERYIGIIPLKNANIYFNRYGIDLKYITYRANKNTTWYILYQQRDDIFLIRHITNNHVAAQYFRY